MDKSLQKKKIFKKKLIWCSWKLTKTKIIIILKYSSKSEIKKAVLVTI